jgi:hypothetical protein
MTAILMISLDARAESTAMFDAMLHDARRQSDSSTNGGECSVACVQAQNEASLAYKDEFERWQSELGVRVKVATRDTFIDMFDDDDQLEYEPATTAAIILTGGDEDAEKAALMVRTVRFDIERAL